MKLTKIFLIFALGVAAYGCATVPVPPTAYEQGNEAFAAKDYLRAFNSYVESYIYGETSQQVRESIRDRISKSAELRTAGKTELAATRLLEMKVQYGAQSGLRLVLVKLELLKPYIDSDDLVYIQSCVDAVFHVDPSSECVVPKKYARIFDVQVIDQSTGKTTTGAEVGAMYGQAAYIDNSNVINYSAQKQVGYGLLGGLLGSMTDSAPMRRFSKTYFLRDANGDTQKILVVDSDPNSIPVGQCVEFVRPSYMEMVNDGFCAQR